MEAITAQLIFEAVRPVYKMSQVTHTKAEANAIFLSNLKWFLLSSPPDMQKIVDVATFFKVSPRTLRRKLLILNTSYRKEVTKIKIAIGKRFLEDTEITVTNIGHFVGYKDASNFSRMFRQHEGLAPISHRKLTRNQ